GVNAIAKEAGVDKVLIYRYFNDLDGLLQAFALDKDFVSNLRKFFGDRKALATRKEAVALGKGMLAGQFRRICEDRELQEVLLWELHEKNRVTEAVAEARETQGIAVLRRMADAIGDDTIDIAAIASLLVGGIYYLALRSRTVEVYSGINLRTEEGRNRIEAAVAFLLDMLARGGERVTM
ncbi:MAG TPA: TetR family transcriptional regulator, partial [Syntrophorhabdales bacterium]|nr:TetR family transcriptional regulator [Syntrophorhabdales bacterium]